MPHLAIVPRVLTAALLAFTSYPVAAEPLPAGFVRLRELAPAIAQDIRYATPFNFTGAPAPGYGRGECVLTRAAADAVIRVEKRLARQGYGLKLFDCYRPARAVAAFNDWVKRPGTADLGRIFHPGIARGDLVAKGYIAGNSNHSRGSTVDVGLVRAGEPAIRTIRAVPPSMSASSAPAKQLCRRPQMPAPATVLSASARPKAASISVRASTASPRKARSAIPASPPRPAAIATSSPPRWRPRASAATARNGGTSRW